MGSRTGVSVFGSPVELLLGRPLIFQRLVRVKEKKQTKEKSEAI